MSELTGQARAAERPLTAQDMLDALGEDDRGARDLLPESYFPVSLAKVGYDPSASAGTPGLRLLVRVVDGPLAGSEMDQRDATIWLTPGKPESRGNLIPLLNHMTRAVTGKYADVSVLAQYGFQPSDVRDSRRTRDELKLWYADLDETQKLDCMGRYLRIDEWDGKKVIAFVRLNDETMVRDGAPVIDDATGQPRIVQRNQIGNLYAWDDPKHGFASWKRDVLPQQEKALASTTTA